MTLARPGQILLSAIAEPLARRAARELGERSEHLHVEIARPLALQGRARRPGNLRSRRTRLSPRCARRSRTAARPGATFPLWRRPTALAAELLLVVGIGTGAWFLTRPTPAIAFNERDWVVVGDLRNLTGQTGAGRIAGAGLPHQPGAVALRQRAERPEGARHAGADAARAGDAARPRDRERKSRCAMARAR